MPPAPILDREFVAVDDAMIVTTGPETTVSLSVMGVPVAQPRIRFRRIIRAFRVIPYDPAQLEKRAFRTEVLNAFLGVGATRFPLFDVPAQLRVTVTFYVFDMRKDIDNLIKFCLDSLEGVVFRNDAMIYEVLAKKIRSTRNTQFMAFEVVNLLE